MGKCRLRKYSKSSIFLCGSSGFSWNFGGRSLTALPSADTGYPMTVWNELNFMFWPYKYWSVLSLLMTPGGDSVPWCSWSSSLTLFFILMKHFMSNLCKLEPELLRASRLSEHWLPFPLGITLWSNCDGAAESDICRRWPTDNWPQIDDNCRQHGCWAACRRHNNDQVRYMPACCKHNHCQDRYGSMFCKQSAYQQK